MNDLARHEEVGRLRGILDAMDDAIVTADLEGRVIDWNERACELFGWSADEVRGRHVGSFLVPEYARDTFFDGLDQYQRTGETSVLEQHMPTTALCGDGREISVEISTSIVASGDTIVCAMFFRDRSERRGDERQLVRRMLEARLLQEGNTTLPDDVDSVIATSLEVACQMTDRIGGLAYRVDGRLLHGLTGWFDPHFQGRSELLAQHQRSSINGPSGLLGRVLESKRAASLENPQHDPELSGIWNWSEAGIQRFSAVPVVVEGRVEVLLLLLATATGESPREMKILIRNVAAQLARFLERRRREEERGRLVAIVNGSFDAIIGKSMDGRILSWNEGATRIYGYTAAEAVGQSVAIVLPDGVTTEEPKILDAVRYGRRLTEFETWRRHKDGRSILVSITVSPIRDSRGRAIGASTIERDVTRRRERELELREAKEIAERANSTKSEFLANISHELRTPMNAIIGMLDLALEERLEQVTEDYLETARDSAHTLLYLLNDLLDFSRMEAGRFELENEPFQLRDTLDAVVKTLSLRAYEKGLELACRIEGDVPDHLRGDGRRLRQILVNLVGNAIKFTEQGEIVVHARVESRTDGEALLRIAVRDTGIGIAEADCSQIFDAFSQADASSTRQYQGTGLGLAITRELVRKMGGTIGVSSTPGKGSTFDFTARFRILGDRSPAPVEREAAVAELRNLPVLVVDDNATNRIILAEMLQNWNMQPVVVSNGVEAIERLEEARARDCPFPLVVVDALMPELDGFELVRRIRERQLSAKGTVLMLSSADRTAFREQTASLDVDALLEKPVSQSAMMDAIMTTLHGPLLEHSAIRQIVRAPRVLRLLVAEDTPANQKVVRSILTKRGHNVDIAHNGRDALEMHQDGDYDAILMDVQMPTMDGLQATRAIRSLDDDRAASVPIIAMTAHAMRGDRERCLAAGMDAYIAKPIDARHLVDLVEELVAASAVAPSRIPAAVRPKSSTDTTDMDSHPFDRTLALARLGNDEQLLHDLFGYYRDDSVALLATLRRELEEGDPQEAERAAHSLKGLSANLEAVRARDVASAIERLIRDGEPAKAREHLSDLEQAVGEVCAAFDAP